MKIGSVEEKKNNINEGKSVVTNFKNEIKQIFLKNPFCFWSFKRSDDPTKAKENPEANTTGWSEMKGMYID